MSKINFRTGLNATSYTFYRGGIGEPNRNEITVQKPKALVRIKAKYAFKEQSNVRGMKIEYGEKMKSNGNKYRRLITDLY